MLVWCFPIVPLVSMTAVGPRRVWRAEVLQGTTITDRHRGALLNPSCDTTMTGRVPRCSEPDRGSTVAQ
jgi:hypothetical protein